jgi:hypothetical protein
VRLNFRHTLLFLLAVVLAVVLFAVISGDDAEANERTERAWPFSGSLTHKSPDRGFDDPIAIKCWVNGTIRVRHIPEGESSGDYGCGEVTGIYAAINQEIFCTSRVIGVDDWTIRGNGLWRNYRDYPYTCVNGLSD